MTTGHNSSEKHLYRSDLKQTALPEVLVTVHRYRVPGVIECTRGDETKRVFIDDGNIIFATSSNVADSLGDRLLNAGRITIEQYRESVRMLVRGGGKRQGAILVEMRALQPKELFIAVREQVQAIVRSLFLWESGEVVFRPGRDRNAEFIKLGLAIPQALLEGVLAVGDPKQLLARIGSRTTLLERTSEPVPVHLTPAEEELLKAVNGRRTLLDLASLPFNPPSVNGQLLYAFWALRLVSVKEPKQIKVQVKTRRSN